MEDLSAAQVATRRGGTRGSDAYPRQIAPRRANASARKRADRMPVGTVGRVLNQSTPCVMRSSRLCRRDAEGGPVARQRHRARPRLSAGMPVSQNLFCGTHEHQGLPTDGYG